jgi:hypothetical protein
MSNAVPVPQAVVTRLRKICLALPEVEEEAAWVGTRWCIRKKNFAHVLMISSGQPAAYAKAAGTDGPACVLTFRSPLPELDVYAFGAPPFFKPGWWPNIVGMQLGAAVDSREVGELLFDSYRLLAPARLARAAGG